MTAAGRPPGLRSGRLTSGCPRHVVGRFAREGVLPVGFLCVPQRSCGKTMEMSHSGLVRLPAKEVGVEAPREFESPHLRQSESPGVQQRAGALSLAQQLLTSARPATLLPIPTEWSTPRGPRSTLEVVHQLSRE